MRKTIAAALILVVASPLAAAQPTTQLQSQALETNPSPVQAGEDADAVFRIENRGSTAAEGLVVVLQGGYPFEIKPDRRTRIDVGTLEPGQNRIISTDILVAEDAPEGPSEFKIKTRTNTRNITTSAIIDVQQQDIELSIQGLSTSPSDLKPDVDDARLTAEVANNGEKQAESAVLTIDLPSDFRETSSFSTRKPLGNIQRGQTKSTDFVFDTLETTETGLRTIPYELTYTEDDDTEQITKTGTFDLYISGVPQFQIDDVQSGLVEGAQGTVTVEFRNTGSVESESTRVRILETGDQPFTYSSAADFVGSLGPNETGTAKFEVQTDASASKQEYRSTFEFRGVHDTSVKVEDETVALDVEQQRSGSNGFNPVFAGAGAVLLLVAIALFYFRDSVRQKLQEI